VRVKNREIPAGYLSPSPSSPPARGGEIIVFTISSTLVAQRKKGARCCHEASNGALYSPLEAFDFLRNKNKYYFSTPPRSSVIVRLKKAYED
jgi:hypothetical protein